MVIAQVQSAEDLEAVRRLFEEYWAGFGFTPCFQNFAGELAALPGEYAPPRGALVLAKVDSRVAGCAALRPFDAARCEAKRLYVRPGFRGQGIGLALLEWVVARAREAGYREIVGDTMPVMERALAMYDQFGFERCEPYAENPTPGAIYLRLNLSSIST
jgi:GNAT superfamily N-acetyltransferase